MGRTVLHPPSAKEVKAARLASGLTQSKAAALVHCSTRSWQNWELSCSLMHPAFWELFKLKVK